MYKQEIERKFLVNISKLPDLSDYECIYMKQGYLNGPNDTLSVRVRSINDEKFILETKDGGLMVRNELTFNISKDEFDISYALCGNKTITKRRYLVPSEKNNGKILEVDIYDNFDFITCEYEGESLVDVESLILEDWFLEELTDKPEYTNQNLSFTKSNSLK